MMQKGVLIRLSFAAAEKLLCPVFNSNFSNLKLSLNSQFHALTVPLLEISLCSDTSTRV